MNALRALIAPLFLYGILILVAHSLGKPLQPFIPIAIVFLIIAINARRQSTSNCGWRRARRLPHS